MYSVCNIDNAWGIPPSDPSIEAKRHDPIQLIDVSSDRSSKRRRRRRSQKKRRKHATPPREGAPRAACGAHHHRVLHIIALALVVMLVIQVIFGMMFVYYANSIHSVIVRHVCE
jgi:hypothetical protein